MQPDVRNENGQMVLYDVDDGDYVYGDHLDDLVHTSKMFREGKMLTWAEEGQRLHNPSLDRPVHPRGPDFVNLIYRRRYCLSEFLN